MELANFQNREQLFQRASVVTTVLGVVFQVWCAVYDVGHQKVFSLNQTMTPTPYDILPSMVY